MTLLVPPSERESRMNKVSLPGTTPEGSAPLEGGQSETPSPEVWADLLHSLWDTFAPGAVEESRMLVIKPHHARWIWMALSKDWRDISTAPLDGTMIAILTQGGQLVKASYGYEYESNEGPVGGWAALDYEPHPSCWTDGVCWASNADGEPSDQPALWRPLPAGTGLSGGGDGVPVDSLTAQDEP